jgi:hypothetical protein
MMSLAVIKSLRLMLRPVIFRVDSLGVNAVEEKHPGSLLREPLIESYPPVLAVMPSEIIITLAFPLTVLDQLCHAIHWHIPDKDVTLPESVASAILLEGRVPILMHCVGCLGMQNRSEGLQRGCHGYQSLLGEVLSQREKLWVLWERRSQRKLIRGVLIENEL